MFLTCGLPLHLPYACSDAAVLGLVKSSLEAASGTTRPAGTFLSQASFAHPQQLPVSLAYMET